MKNTGMVRRLDDLGRVVIPKELRNVRDIKEGDPIEILTDEDMICLRKYEPRCKFCGSTEQILEVEGIHICRNCGNKIVRKFMGVQ